MELQEKVNLMHFKIRASCDQAVALDFFQLKLRNELQGSKRPVSAPSLAELSSAAAGKRFATCSLTQRGVHCNDPF